MLNYSGYYNKSDDDLPNDCLELFVKSCGHYKTASVKKLRTYDLRAEETTSCYM
jgi:hypothetical protein